VINFYLSWRTDSLMTRFVRLRSSRTSDLHRSMIYFMALVPLRVYIINCPAYRNDEKRTDCSSCQIGESLGRANSVLAEVLVV